MKKISNRKLSKAMSNLKPPFMKTVQERIPVADRLASITYQHCLRSWLADSFHSLINNTFREAGLECEGRLSELTWEIAVETANTVLGVIGQHIADERERRATRSKAAEVLQMSKQQQLAEAQATVERLKKELNVE